MAKDEGYYGPMIDDYEKRISELEAAHSKIFDLLIEVRGFQPRSPVCPALQEAIDLAATMASSREQLDAV